MEYENLIIGQQVSSLLKYIGLQEVSDDLSYGMFNATRTHGALVNDSTYLDVTLKKRNYFRVDGSSGGKSDGLSIEDIAKMNEVSYNHIVNQVIKGVEVESEYTEDEYLAKKIAMDYLVEDPNYYDLYK